MDNWSIGIRAMLAALKHDRYDSLEDIDAAIDAAEKELGDARQYMRDLYLKKAACIHAYKPATYSIQGRLIGFVRVNEQVCRNCGHQESQTENDDGTNRPEWAKDAKKTYYNNNI